MLHTHTKHDVQSDLSTYPENTMSANHKKHSRIPHTLQSVFLASNRGRKVDKPPPNCLGTRVFRTWSKKRPTADQKIIVATPATPLARKRYESMGSKKIKVRESSLARELCTIMRYSSNSKYDPLSMDAVP